MKALQYNTRTNRTRGANWRATLALAGAALCLAFGVRSNAAGGGGEPILPGGGDAIGSLPYSTPICPLSGYQSEPSLPSIVFEGPNLAAIHSVVLDATGSGYAEYFAPDGNRPARVELQGRVTVILDRNRLATSGVRYAMDVSQGFSGGLLVITGGLRPTSSQGLPVTGDLALPLNELAVSGILDEGALRLHSISLAKKHHVLELSCSGGTLRMQSRD